MSSEALGESGQTLPTAEDVEMATGQGQMAGKPSAENKLMLPTEKAVEEEMEVTVATQLENLNVTPGDAHTTHSDTNPDTHTPPSDTHAPSGTHTDSEGERRDAHAHPSDVTPPLQNVCVSEGVCAGGSVCVKGESENITRLSADSDSDSSSSSSSSCSSPRVPVLRGNDDDDDEGFSQPAPIKTRDEVLLEELPAVEDVCISLPEEAELQPIGTVSSIIQQLVIIQSLKDTPPLTDDSIIFNSDRLSVGKVFEVFGPVSCPFYVLRYNSSEQVSAKALTVGQTVFYTPDVREYTGYILTQQLKQLKGSDASWKNDQEPPPEALEYSDDDDEQEAKRKKRQNTKKKRDDDKPDTDAPSTPQVTHSPLHQQRDVRGFPPRNAGAPFRHQNPRLAHTPFRHTHTPFRHTHPPPRHTQTPPLYLPPPCPYPPPPFPPHSFPLYPPPPPPSFSHLASPPWSHHSIHPSFPFSHLPPPPPPPHPPPQ